MSWLVCLAIVTLAAALRWRALDRESLWFDEGWTWWLTSLPTGRMMRIIRGDVVAPAYFYLLHFWTLLFGDAAVALRSLSALLSTLAFVPFLFIASHVCSRQERTDEEGRRMPADLEDGLAARATGWLPLAAALALVGLASIQIQFARDARPYALLLLATLGALACAIRAAERRSRGAVAGFVACCVVGLYTHNMMAFAGVGLAGAWLLWPGDRPMRGRLIDLVVAGGVIAVCYAPWLPVLREQARWIAGKFWLSPPTMETGTIDAAEVVGVVAWAVPAVAWERFGLQVMALTAARLTVALALLGGLLAFATRDRSRCRRAVALAWFVLAPPLLVVAYGAVAQPLAVPRLFIASGAIAAILIAMPLARGRLIVVRFLGAGVVLALLGLMAMSTSVLLGTPQKEDWRGAYEQVARLPASDRRLVVFVATEGELPFGFYASHDRSRVAEARTGAPGGFFDVDPPQTIRRVLSDADLNSLRAQLASGRWDEVVLVLGHDHFSDPAGRTEAELRSRGRPVDEWSSRHIRVLRFVLEGAAP